MLIAQITDIHASPDNNNLDRFDQVMAWLAHLKTDVLVLTGDMVEGQWRQGYEHIAGHLSRLGYPTLLLPGNAENRALMRSVWSNQLWANDVSGEALHFTHDAGELRLIGLDSTVEGEDVGCVTDHLAWLEQQLAAADDSPSLLFLHHHVFTSGIPTLDATMCRGRDKLEALLHHYPAKLLMIATGHVHRPVAGLFAGIPAYICGSVCPANPVWFGTENVPPANDSPALMIHRYVDDVLSCHHVCV